MFLRLDPTTLAKTCGMCISLPDLPGSKGAGYTSYRTHVLGYGEGAANMPCICSRFLDTVTINFLYHFLW